jgi:ketosteroid isomerase-like protein
MTEMIGGLGTAVLAAIRSARERQEHSIVTADWNEFMQAYDEQAVIMAPNLEPLDTPAKLRAYIENFPKIEVFRLTSLETDGREDLAYERGRYDLTAAGVSDHGSYFTLWRRQRDGAWKIFRDIWHSDRPAAMPSDDK